MNPNKICFIICVNNEIFLKECITYINQLIVPENFIVDVLEIQDAQSMLAGYHEACDATDALYKVFMHQDVFILNRHFIYDILAIFNGDPDIGLIGMTGIKSVPDNYIMWSGELLGNLYTGGNPGDHSTYRYDLSTDGYDIAEAVDGLLMAVKGSPVFRDDIFDGWDFYDLSLSLEIQRSGKRVVVPRQRTPWCLHDDGNNLNMLNYDHYRKLAINEYQLTSLRSLSIS